MTEEINIKFNLENCYGIPKFNNVFKFNSTNKAYLIYAPNGTMKTSFANTLKDISIEAETKDFYYPEKKSLREIKFENDKNLTKYDILVVEQYLDKYESQSDISTLLVNEKLRNKHSQINKKIKDDVDRLLKAISVFSGKYNQEDIICNDFECNSKKFYDCLEHIYDSASFINFNKNCNEDFSDIKYGKVFTADSEIIINNSEFKNKIKIYMEQYGKLLTESMVFKKCFNHTKAENVSKTLNKSGFFSANHKILLNNSNIALDENKYNEILIKEKERLLNDKGLVSELDKIDQLLSTKVGANAFRDYIFENKEIILELINVNEFKKKLWLSYFHKEITIFTEIIKNYKTSKNELLEIFKKASETKTEWDDVVSQFNARFSNMPFSVKIINKEDAILTDSPPSFMFKFNNRGEEIEVGKDKLINHLSTGEKKALHLLDVIFEIEARKKLENKTLLIIDDIADSFDYRNKYAIIEYIKDIVDCGKFMCILLTHNFDFYRTVAGRIEIKRTSFFVQKSNESIQLKHGEYFENVFKFWKSNLHKDDKIFISSICFVRNLIEYLKDANDKDYIQLTYLLHSKKNPHEYILPTHEVTNEYLIKCYDKILNIGIDRFEQNKSEKVLDLINKTAKSIIEDPNPDYTKIEDKIVLTIAIRQMAEKYMILRINDDLKVANITNNQTRKLMNMIIFNENNQKDLTVKNILNKVLIITSENIHLNSFMFEPIVDMSLEELITLYKDVDRCLSN